MTMSTLHQPTTTRGGPAGSGRALARCVPDPEAFASAWGRAAVHATAAELPQPFDDLLDLDAVDELLSRRGLRTPFLRMAKDGAVVPPSRFTRPGGVGAAIGDQVDEAAVARLFADGTTIVLQALHRIWPPVIEFAGRLRDDVGHPVQVNAYVTPPSSRGFSAHYDIHDVFVLQVAGEKRWIVHEPCFEAPLRSQPWTERRAEVERTVAETEPTSTSCSGPATRSTCPEGSSTPPRRSATCARISPSGCTSSPGTRWSRRSPRSRSTTSSCAGRCPSGSTWTYRSTLADELRATVAALVAYAEETEPEPVVEHLRESLASTARPAPIAPLAQAAAARSVDAAMSVRLREGLAARLDAVDGVARLEHRTGTLALDGSVTAALEMLLDGDVHTVETLPGEPGEVQELVRTLLRESVVERLAAEHHAAPPRMSAKERCAPAASCAATSWTGPRRLPGTSCSSSSREPGAGTRSATGSATTPRAAGCSGARTRRVLDCCSCGGSIASPASRGAGRSSTCGPARGHALGAFDDDPDLDRLIRASRWESRRPGRSCSSARTAAATPAAPSAAGRSPPR